MALHTQNIIFLLLSLTRTFAQASMSEVKKAVFWNESDDGGVSIRE
jgi:hypothetical protein